MHLRSLTLKGFKSFAEKAVLSLEPGVTVVVGPNGSGKSNLVDAMAWVLGAQGPSTVRSGKMDDVIFAGTEKMPALGRAEVQLTVDNSDHLLPIDFTEVTLSRTLFRSGDSEYAINGVPCRLLDIQDLLSDSGIGRTQHVIVSQGQLDDVLKARPTDRRLIIEEAAGVLKFRKRKEKAERRLAATEANVLRLQDLLREVRRQLRPLERQADAARRHGDLVGELNAIRLHLAGREIEATRTRLAAAETQRGELAAQEKDVRTHLGELDVAVLSSESSLSGTGADDVGDALVRYEALREKARGLLAVLAERRRGIERDRGAYLDQAVAATLDAEAARLQQELVEVEAEAAELVPAAERLAAAEADLATARAEFEAQWGDDEAIGAGRAAEARGELTALRTGLAQGAQEAQRLASRLATLDEKSARLAAEADRLRATVGEAEAAERPLVAELEIAEGRRSAADDDLAAADAALRAADAERQRWRARAEALALALDDARIRAGAARLADLDGVRGTLLDLVAVDDGYERAFEAALGEALAAVVVDSPAAAREALALLRQGDGAGAVLALGVSRPSLSLVHPVGEPLRDHVRPLLAEVGPLLDALLAGCVIFAGSWEAALEASIADPSLVVVTPDGDRFSRGGWRVGLGGTGATGAALEEAIEKAEAANALVERAEAVVEEARSALHLARQGEADLARRLDDNDGRLSAATDGLQRLEAERRDVATEADTLRGHLAEVQERVESDTRRVAELEAALGDLEAEEEAVANRARTRREAQADLDERARAVGALRSELEVRAASLEERRTFLRRRHQEVDARLDSYANERVDAERRRAELDRSLTVVDGLRRRTEERLADVEVRLNDLRERRRRQSESTRRIATRLDHLRRERATAERTLEELRERERRVELDQTEARVKLEALVEALRHDLDAEPDQAIAAPCPEMAEGTNPRARARELERELKLMGPINPLALQEFEELRERHEFLESQLDDVRSTRRDLAKVIRAVDAEIVEVFAAAFADVSENFAALFQTLFPGGKGRLVLTEPDNLLETGIELEARPAGKNVKKLTLLSGGERSLTALAFLFAVFRSRPSPFYVLDEVEAALDDMNLHRFLDLVDEFRREAQLIIVSHQKRTMEAADCLYGVTMQPGGSTKVVSEKLSAAS